MKTYPDIVLANNFKLTPLSQKHVTQLFDLIQRNRDVLEKYFPWPPYIKTLEDEENAVRDFINLMQDKSTTISKMIEFVIIDENNNALGMVDFHSVDNDNMSAEIGYWITKEFEGKGIASDATRKICTYGYNVLNLDEIKIITKKDNERSKNVAVGLGFKTDNVVDNEGQITYKMAVTQWNSTM